MKSIYIFDLKLNDNALFIKLFKHVINVVLWLPKIMQFISCNRVVVCVRK